MAATRRRNTQNYERAASSGRFDQNFAAALGYGDAAAGRGFSLWYESATKDQQLAYEVGRHWATNQRAAGIEPPPWRAAGPPPVAVQRANELAAKRGEAYATPWGTFPDTDDPVLLEPLGVKLRRAADRTKPGKRRRRRPLAVLPPAEDPQLAAVKQLMRDAGMEFEGDTA